MDCGVILCFYFKCRQSASNGGNICSFSISVVLVHVILLLRTSGNTKFFEVIKLQHSPTLIYRVHQSPIYAMQVFASVDISFTYSKTLHWLGQIVCFMLQLVYIQCKFPLLSIEQESGQMAEPFRLLTRKEKISVLIPHLSTQKMECFLGSMASRLHAVLITDL